MAVIPPWMRSRHAVIFSVILLSVVFWNALVALSDDGLVVGRVVDNRGEPASGATVVMYEAGLLIDSPRQRAVTDRLGRFRFSGHGLHHFRLQATMPGVGRSGSETVRLYFRNQNFALDEPLRLEAAESSTDTREAPAEHAGK